jgi:hypothetical protein
MQPFNLLIFGFEEPMIITHFLFLNMMLNRRQTMDNITPTVVRNIMYAYTDVFTTLTTTTVGGIPSARNREIMFCNNVIVIITMITVVT